jgi:23S rRNA (adenine2503-C2)-methyltransferase
MTGDASDAASSGPAPPVDLGELDHDELVAWALDALGEPATRAERIFRAIHARGGRDLATLPGVARGLRQRLARTATLGGLRLDRTLVDPDGTRKLLLRTHDGHAIEAVLFPMDEAYSLCLSSQVGCNRGCRFCLTGTRRRARDLTAGEIVAQAAAAARVLADAPAEAPAEASAPGGAVPDRTGARPRTGEPGKAIGNLVFMGMGEPLDNYDAVVRAIRILQHPLGADVSSRRITVSTAGVVPGIDRLGREPDLTVNLAVSLNATTDAVRSRVMPVNRVWPLGELFAALRRFPVPRRRRITIEYVLLDGVNDTPDDARRLVELTRDLPCKVNLLAFNPWDGAPYGRPAAEAVATFQAALRAQGLTVTVRVSRGRGVGAACGQLGGQAAGASAAPDPVGAAGSGGTP